MRYNKPPTRRCIRNLFSVLPDRQRVDRETIARAMAHADKKVSQRYIRLGRDIRALDDADFNLVEIDLDLNALRAPHANVIALPQDDEVGAA